MAARAGRGYLAGMRSLIPLAALLALGACASPPPAPDPAIGENIVWRCEGGVTFAMRLTAGGNAEVVAGGKTYWLPAKKAASGGRYTDGKVEFWEHGAEAMLRGAAGGPYSKCAR